MNIDPKQPGRDGATSRAAGGHLVKLAAGPKIQGPALLSGKRVRPLGEKDKLHFLCAWGAR